MYYDFTRKGDHKETSLCKICFPYIPAPNHLIFKILVSNPPVVRNKYSTTRFFMVTL